MEKVKFFMIRFFGYSCFLIGAITVVIGILGLIGYLLSLMTKSSYPVSLNYTLGNLCRASFILFTGIGILGRKKWGRPIAIIFLVYSLIYPIAHIVKYYKIDRYWAFDIKLIIFGNAIFGIFSILLLYFFISPKIKTYFENVKQPQSIE